MSHLSQIQTNFHDLNILKKTLDDLGFIYKDNEDIIEINNIYTNVDLLILSNLNGQIEYKEPILGFIYDGVKYVLVTDIYLWQLDIPVDQFVHNLTQAYALNVILSEANQDGFQSISQMNRIDGSIELVIQKWNN